jgi:hypothetical protein
MRDNAREDRLCTQLQGASTACRMSSIGTQLRAFPVRYLLVSRGIMLLRLSQWTLVMTIIILIIFKSP